jgi:hypothetical protein
MGCGKNGSFDKIPDLRQWAVLQVFDASATSDTASYATPAFLLHWWQFFHCELSTVVMEPLEGHGKWDGKECFGNIRRQADDEGPVGVLTRATIRIPKLKSFWSNVPGVTAAMNEAEGLICTVGIGEIPWIKQATFSIWENREAMKNFAYRMKAHAAVIRKTREDNWYSEEMFVRFKILSINGFRQHQTGLEINW